MSQAAAQQPSRKKTVISLLVLLALTCIIVFTFKDHWAEITAALAQLSVWQVLSVLAVGVSYPLLEGCVAWVIVRSRLPQFTLRQGLDVGWCGTFGNVVTLGAGAVPVQLYYLHRAGLPLGPGAGLMTLEYVFHKSTVLLYATVMLLLQRRWLAANTTRCHALPAHGIRCGSGDYCDAGAAVCFAAGAKPRPLAAGLSAQDRKVAAAPRRLAGAAGSAKHREPPTAGR